MKYATFLQAFLVLPAILLGLSVASGTCADLLTLEKALSLARTANPALDQAEGRIAQARAALSESRSAFWPRVEFSLEYLRGDAPSAYLFKTIDARQLPPGTDFNEPGRFDNWETGAQAHLNLYAGGRDKLRHQQARLGLEQARSERAAIANALDAAVIDTYLALATAQTLVDIARQSLAVVDHEIKLAEVRFAGGSLLRADLLSLQVRRAEAQAEIIRARALWQRLQAALAVLLDRDAHAPLEIASDRYSYDPPDDYAQALERALSQRPELAGARFSLQRARLERGVARSEYRPRLDLEARLYHDDSDLSYNAELLNWTLGARLSWAIFSGFATPAREESARGLIQESLAAERQLHREIELEVRQAWLAVEEAVARQAVTMAAVAQAEEAFSLVRTRFEGGAADVTRYLEAELALSRSRMVAAAAERDRLRTLAELARALGDEHIYQASTGGVQ
jgi:outer membrane protein